MTHLFYSIWFLSLISTSWWIIVNSLCLFYCFLLLYTFPLLLFLLLTFLWFFIFICVLCITHKHLMLMWFFFVDLHMEFEMKKHHYYYNLFIWSLPLWKLHRQFFSSQSPFFCSIFVYNEMHHVFHHFWNFDFCGDSPLCCNERVNCRVQLL